MVVVIAVYLLYASEALSLNSAQLKSLNSSAKCVLFEVFKTASPDSISDCQEFFNFPDVYELILKCKTKFRERAIYEQ